MKTLTEEWNHAHQNRRIVVKARNVLWSFVEIEREREANILFYFLSFEQVVHTIEEKQEILGDQTN
jgi:hypothetical protein